MSFDFDQSPARADTDSQKWQKYAGRDVLPMWVADMDFKACPAIVEALHARVDHGIFGYARPVKSTVDAVVEMFQRRHGWEIHPAWIVWLPGLVVGLNIVAQAFAEAGDEVLTLTPVYPPFLSAPKNSGRVTVQVPFGRDATAGVVAEVNALGYAACEAAYRDGEPWRQALLDYLRANRDLVIDFVAREMPGVSIEGPIEATYLAWLNVASLKLEDPVAHFEAHGVGLSDGAYFGCRQGTHVRLNFGCPRSTLREGLLRLKRGVQAALSSART